MTLLWTDSFESNANDMSFQRHYEYTANLATLNYGWIEGRFNGEALQGAGTPTADFRKVDLLSSPGQTIFLGFALKCNLPTDGTNVFSIRDNSPNGQNVRLYCRVWNDTANYFFLTFVNDHDETVAITKKYSQQEWIWFETKIFLNATIGSIEWRVNEVTEFIKTNINTCGDISNNDWASVGFELSSTGAGSYMGLDDLIISDEQGSLGEDGFWGDVSIQALYPVTDRVHNEWTASGGGSHENDIDDGEAGTVDDAAGYLETSDDGERDYFSFTSATRIQDAVLALHFQSDVSCPDGTQEFFSYQESNENRETPGVDKFLDSFDYNMAAWKRFFTVVVNSWTPENIKRNIFGVKAI